MAKIKREVTWINSTSFGLGLTITLFLSALKLAGEISWPWWIVTLPIWGGAAFFLALFLSLIVIMGIAILIDAIW